MNPTSETEIVREIFAALNRNDIPGVVKFFDSKIERVEPPGHADSDTYRGLQDVSAHFQKARDTWVEGACNLERMVSSKDKVLAFIYVRVRVKNRTDWAEGNTFDAFSFKNGKVTEMRTFLDRDKALEWAGLTSNDL